MKFSRADWGARPANGGPGALTRSRVKGIALHWPAMSRPVRGVNAVKSALRGWQNYHMNSNGWSDIAYQVAVDQDGNRYELRGLATQSGANGGTSVNEEYGAILLVLAPGEQPSNEMVREVRAVIAEHRALFPNSRRVVGHGDIRPGGTECPGPIVQRLINIGAFNTANAPDLEDDMPLNNDDIDKIAHAVWAKEIGGGRNRESARLHLIWASNASRTVQNELRSKVNQLKASIRALPEGATKAEVADLLEDLDATIKLVVNEAEGK